MKNKIINYIIGLIFLIYYCICIYNSYLQLVFHKNGWYLGEWLINYQDGGFKRRGLFGSLFILLNELTHIQLEFIVFAFVSIIYAVFFTLLIQLFMQKKNTLLTVSIILLPAGLGMLLKDPTIIAKKEILIFLLYLLYFLRLESQKTVKDIVVTIFIILAILNHEAAFFFIPFVSFTYFMKDNAPSFTKLKKIILYHWAPAVAVILLLYQFGYSISTANSIQFLREHGLNLVLKGIYGYDPSYNVLNFYKAHSYGYITYLISLFFASATFYIYCRSNKISINSKFLVIQAVFLIPLFYIAYDWGRWINIFFTLLTIFIAGEQQIAGSLKQDITAIVLIVFNSLWRMLLFTAGFLTIPAVDSMIKNSITLSILSFHKADRPNHFLIRNMKTRIINYLISLLFALYYYVSITTSYTLIVVKKGGWCFGDWIINYQDGGFKRRGFFGTLFMWINELTHISLEHIVFSFVALLYTAIFYLLVRLFWNEKNNILVIALVLLPVGFGMMVKDPAIATRKEMLFFFLYLLYILCLRSKVAVKDFTITVFITIALLTHEAAYFYLPFVGMAYFMKNEGPSRDKLRKILLYQFLPATVLMMILYQFGISLKTENTIPFFKEHGLVLEEMGIFDYDPNYDVLGYYKAHSYDYQTYGISILLGALTVYIYCKFNKIKINTLFLIIQILFLIPLFYLAVDWGRWTNIFFSLLTIFLAAEQRAILSKKQEIIAVILILFNLSWRMMLMTQGFLTFPQFDDFLKQVYYFLYFRITNLL